MNSSLESLLRHQCPLPQDFSSGSLCDQTPWLSVIALYYSAANDVYSQWIKCSHVQSHWVV